MEEEPYMYATDIHMHLQKVLTDNNSIYRSSEKLYLCYTCIV